MSKPLLYSVLTFSFLVCIGVSCFLTRENARKHFLSNFKSQYGRTPASTIAYNYDYSYIGNESPNF